MSDNTITVGIVGLGSMGLGMAQTLAAGGFAVVGFDLSPERRAAAAAIGAVGVERVSDVFGEADFIVFSLPTAKDVAAVVESNLALLETRTPGRVVVIDTSTSEPDVSRRLAERLAALGHGFLDAPVSGGPNGAASGNLTMMIGGAEADVAAARPVIDAMASKVLHVGPSGAGNVAKLVNNLLVAAHMLTTSEGLKLAVAAGVDADAALRVVNAATGRSALSEIHFPTWILSDRFDSGFSMGLMRKDVRLAREMAARAGLSLPLTEAAGSLWAASAQRLADTEDFTRMGAMVPDAAAPMPTGHGAPSGSPADPRGQERGDPLLERGKTIRAEVIGQQRSDAALAGATEFDLPFQELALRYCWGEVWDRPGLDRRTRSIANLSMLSAMGKPNELKIHVRGALTNGVTREEIKEIFLQTCIYAGVPSAGEAFKIAREVFEEPDFAGLG